MMVRKSIKYHLNCEFSNYIVNVSFDREKFWRILKKFLWGWQSQFQWSSVVLMHSGFAYFSDRSSESWKIVRKPAATATSKIDVIYPWKTEQISSCGNIGHRFCTRGFKLCFCTEIGALPKLSSVHRKHSPPKVKY